MPRCKSVKAMSRQSMAMSGEVWPSSFMRAGKLTTERNISVA